MKELPTFHFFFLSLMMLSAHHLMAQNLPVGTPVVEDYLRRMQLTGKYDSLVSFGVRPLAMPDSTIPLTVSYPLKSKTGHVRIFPATIATRYNTHHPTGWNDGSMAPNKGLQTRVSWGGTFGWKKLRLQLMPELNYRSNSSFDEFTDDHYEVIWQRMYRWWNTIDSPIRFGKKSTLEAHLGQSSLRYNFSGFSTGISTENLWWGPGKRNSLVMSNNAPGFLHFTFNTVRPVTTPIGLFEGQFIAGELRNSGYTPPDPERLYLRSKLYYPPIGKPRYLSGLTISWQPAGIQGLFLGYSRTSQVYMHEISSLRDIQPFFNGIRREGIAADPDLTPNQQQTSGYLRWLLQESNAEFYIEYGTNGRSRTLREFLVQANRHRAFTMGVSKIYPVRNQRFVQIDAEVTQLGQVVREVVRDADSWYTDKYIRQGYTHRGQVLGAGIGPGSNVAYLEVSWWKAMNKIGIFGERLVHNNDFMYFAYEDSKDWRRFYTDLSAGIVADWRFSNVVISSTFRYTRSWNYQWFLLRQPDDPYFVKGRDVTNLHATISASYFFTGKSTD